jgi:Kef-type K+ transport system membrane component KefB
VDLTLLLVPLVAVLAPIAARLLGRWVRIPIVVFELVLGIVIGPAVLGWASPHEYMHTLSQFGLAMLFFVAGTEIELAGLRGRTGRGAIFGWLISIAAGLALGWIVAPGETAVIIGIALASTALGTLLPILRDAGELRTPFGRSVGALGAIGEFGPLVAISVFLGSRSPGGATIVLAVFVVIAAGAVWYALRAPQGALHRFVATTLHTSGQFAVRVVFLILAALVVLSIALDIDMLLGAFTAGIVWRLMIRDASPEDRRAVESKIEAVAFGFLVPVFFIYTGITFDLASLLAQPVLLLLVPLALVVLLVVRGIPSLLAAPARSRRRDRLATMLMGATGLPIIVAVTTQGVEKHILPSWAAAVLVGAGMLSVLVFPLVAMSLRGEQPAAEDATLATDNA